MTIKLFSYSPVQEKIRMRCRSLSDQLHFDGLSCFLEMMKSSSGYPGKNSLIWVLHHWSSLSYTQDIIVYLCDELLFSYCKSGAGLAHITCHAVMCWVCNCETIWQKMTLASAIKSLTFNFYPSWKYTKRLFADCYLN